MLSLSSQTAPTPFTPLPTKRGVAAAYGVKASGQTPSQKNPQFGSITAGFIKALPLGQRAGTWWFTRDNQWVAAGQGFAAVWGPKALVSRSLPELFETTYLEFIEHFLFYFSAGLFGQHVFSHLYSGKSLKNHPVKHLVSRTTEELRELFKKNQITESVLRKTNAAKAGILLASVGALTMGLEYALTFARNLFTEKLFRVNKFSDVVNLSQGKIEDGEKSQYWHRAKRDLIGTALISLGILGLSAGVAKGAPHIKSAKFHKALEWFNRKIDFDFAKVLNPDKSIKKVKYNLSSAQLNLVIWTGVVSYLHATRSWLEFWEVASRLAIVAPYLATQGKIFKWGGQWLFGQKKNALFGLLKRATTSEALRPAKNWVGREQLGWSEVIEKAIAQAKAKSTQPLSQTQLYREAAKTQIFKDAFHMTLWPFLFGVGAVGFGVTKIGQLWTRYRYERSLKEGQPVLVDGADYDSPTQNNGFWESAEVQYLPSQGWMNSPLDKRSPFNQFVNQVDQKRLARLYFRG